MAEDEADGQHHRLNGSGEIWQEEERPASRFDPECSLVFWAARLRRSNWV